MNDLAPDNRLGQDMMRPGRPIARPQPPAHFPPFYRRAAFGFLILAAVAFGLVIYAVLGKAKVVVLAKVENVKKEFVLDVAASPVGDVIPGTALEASAEITRSFPVTAASGEGAAPAEAASKTGRAVVTVRLTSALPYAQTLVATTRLLTPDGILFRLKDRITVPARGSVEASAVADEAGERGFVESATFTIPGLKPETRSEFTVETVGPARAEAAAEDLTPETPAEASPQDIEAAFSVLDVELRGQLLGKLREEANAAGLAAGKVREAISFEVTKKESKPAVGGSFEVTLALKATGVFMDGDRLLDAVRSRLKREVPPELEIRGLNESSLEMSVERIDLAAREATVKVRAKASAAITAAAPSLDRQKVVGISIDAANKYFEGVDGVSSASITVSPFWAGRMPSVPAHIIIEVR
jgi:hypothetical protein